MTTEFPAPPSLDFVSRLGLPQLCGQLIVVGFDGTELPSSVAEALQAGLLGGVILFKRNLPDLETAFRLCREIIAAYPPDVAPFIGVDQEGGRVTRLPPPFLSLPPMRRLGELASPELTHRAGAAVAQQLAALGVTCNFAPVLDVDTNPQNPIIGDRSFSRDPHVVAQHGIAFALGMQDQGVMACGKHFPGHGDTSLDSHLALPTVTRSREELLATEIPPFREAIDAGLASIMTAHVCYPALAQENQCATLSPSILTKLLRQELRFDGVVFSDDLEMQGILQGRGLPEAAVGALRSGCDALLICKGAEHAEEALQALVDAAEQEPQLSTRILEANVRFHRARQAFPPRPQPTLESLNYVLSRPLASEILSEIEQRRVEALSLETARLKQEAPSVGTATTKPETAPVSTATTKPEYP